MAGEQKPLVFNFDNTGSFANMVEPVKQYIIELISQLLEGIPGISFGFGIGRFSDYNYYSSMYGSMGSGVDLPFYLNQPIITTDTEGFDEAIKAALSRTPNGNGEDGAESLIEALYQIATGRGYDGNNDGDTEDNGHAGGTEAQRNGNYTGDVPAWETFVPDPDHNLLPAAGNTGGVGFRSGALPIIICATDIGFGYQPDGSDVVTGVGGVEIPMSYFDDNYYGYYRPETAHGTGATIQETINALNDLGALIVGLGNSDVARHALDALARLTGAVNGSSEIIDNGTSRPIDEGDPYYFDIGQSSQAMAQGIVSAIHSAVFNTRFDIDVIASVDGVPIRNLTGVLKNVGVGELASFDISFLGDGLPHSFDLQFVRSGTNVILGSIPVTISDAYRYDAEAIDADGDTVTYSLVGETHGAGIDPETGDLLWSPPGNGRYEFQVKADDGRGGVTLQTFTVQVGEDVGDNNDPVIDGVSVQEAEVGRAWTAQVAAGDPDGDALSYYLVGDVPAGLSIDGRTGKLEWTPVGGQEGSHTVTVRVQDGRGGADEHTVIFEVHPRQIDRNTKPHFTSTPETTTLVDKTWRHQVTARDAEGDPITLTLLNAPEGVAFDPATGILAWTPGEAALGEHFFAVRASDGRGGVNLYTFTLRVVNENLPPEIVSLPPAANGVGYPYYYLVKAEDPNGDPVTFRLDDASAALGIRIDAHTGLLAWDSTPSGHHEITIYADDGQGGTGIQHFTLAVEGNEPANITSEPTYVVHLGEDYAYRVETFDPDGDPVTLYLDQDSLDRGMTLDPATGTIRWTPAELGSFNVSVTAVDDQGEGVVQHFTINVIAAPAPNTPPVITSQPTLVARQEEQYRYEVKATDAEGDRLTYALVSPPSGMYIDANTGVLTWSPSSGYATGDYTVKIVVTDAKGATATQAFTVTVERQPNRAPRITSSISKFYYNVDDRFSYGVSVSDPDSGDTFTYEVDQASRDAGFYFSGSYLYWTAAEPGYHNVTITVSDRAGATCEQTFTLLVLPPEAGVIPNQPPRIHSRPPLPRITLGDTHTYAVQVTDPENHVISVSGSIEPAAGGFGFDNRTLTCTPAEAGEYVITIVAVDQYGAESTQTYTLIVEEPAEEAEIKRPPYFTSTPPVVSRAGQEYRYEMTAVDPAGGSVRYELDDSYYGYPYGMRVEGNALIWSETYQTGGTVRVFAFNEEGLWSSQEIPLRIVGAADERVYLSGMMGESIEYAVPAQWEGWSATVDSTGANRGVTVADGVIGLTPAAIGDFNATVTFRNESGEVAYLYLTYYISGQVGNQPPVFTDVPADRTVEYTYYGGASFNYAVKAVDPDGGAVTYRVRPGPNSYDQSVYIDSSTGALSWYGYGYYNSDYVHEFEIIARDSLGAETTQMVRVRVTPQRTNFPPVFQSSPNTLVLEAGRDQFSYNFYLEDYDSYYMSDSITVTLDGVSQSLAGMSLQDYGTSGYMSWYPTVDHIGAHEVTLTARDQHGGIATQTFVIHVIERSNRPAAITTQPNCQVALGGSHTYTLSASDPDGDAITYELVEGPEGAEFDGRTVSWTPGAVGEYTFIVKAVDSHGEGMTQTYTVIVSDPPVENNRPARFTNEPEAVGVVDQEYVWHIGAEDPDGDEVSFELDETSRRRGFTLEDGVLRWTPTRAADYSVSVTVLDSHGSGETISFKIHVLPREAMNREPSITSTPSQLAVVGRTYAYQIAAEDQDGDRLTYRIVTGPVGMEIDENTGLLTYTPGLPGVDTIEVAVSDGLYSAIQRFQVVVAVNAPPRITSTPGGVAFLGQEYAYAVAAVDANGDAIVYGLVNPPAGMTIDPATGALTFEPTELGVFTVTVIATDADGAAARQTFTLQVRDPDVNNPPVILSAPREVIAAGYTFSHIIVAQDIEGDALTYSLVNGPAGMVVNPSTGLLSWTPTNLDIQSEPHAFTLRVTDGRGAYTEKTFAVYVVRETGNAAPEITSAPTLHATAGFNYQYAAAAIDPDGDTYTWQLEGAPEGMKIDALSGMVTWKATAGQIGEHSVTVRVTDTLGAWSTQTFTLVVQAANVAPQITSTPPTRGRGGQGWTYAFTAADPDGDALTYSIESGPPGLVIDPATGLVAFTPDAPGDYVIRLVATDARGASAKQQFTVVVDDAAENLPPEFRSNPGYLAQAGVEYTYPVYAFDPNGQALIFSLRSGPDGMAIDPNTGLLTWTPVNGDVGTHRIEILVSDGELGRIQSYTLTVRQNLTPSMPAVADATVTAGTVFTATATAVDPDGDMLEYTLEGAPEGMVIDRNGRIGWMSATANADEVYTVTVRARDPFGAEAVRTFTLTVVPDTGEPEVGLVINRQPVYQGQTAIFTINARDEVGVVKTSITVNGVEIPVNATGQASYTFDTFGTFEVVATAIDAAGNVGTRTLTVNVADPNDVSPPAITVHTPVDGAVVKDAFDLVLSIDDPDSASVTWSVTVRNLETGITFPLASGDYEFVEQLAGTINPAALANGSYALTVQASDAAGHVSSTTQYFAIDSIYKLGNFNLSFTDLQTNVSGLPIVIQRSYDTLNAGKQGEFGYGWNMSFFTVKLTTDIEESGGYYSDDFDIFEGGFKHGTKITVAMPDGTTQVFTVNAKAAGGYYGMFGYVEIELVADDPKSGYTLTLDRTVSSLQMDGYGNLHQGGFAFNPADSWFNCNYILTSKEGLTYNISSSTGEATQITDKLGHIITVSGSAVRTIGRDGQVLAEVLFERDSQGRVVAIVDEAGGRIEYTYDAKGDLVAVKNRVGDTTRFEYVNESGAPGHFLKSIIDGRGIKAIDVDYDFSTGRIRSMGDGAGTLAGITYNTDLGGGLSVETATDAEDNVTEVVTDARGNAVRIVRHVPDPDNQNAIAYQIDIEDFDANGNSLGKARTFIVSQATLDESGQTQYDYIPADLVWEGRSTYDASGNKTTSTDVWGQTTHYTYDANGNVLKTIDPLGRLTENKYDSSGNPTVVIDAAGNKTEYGYDASGNPTSITRTLPDGTVQQLASTGYNDKGQLTRMTDLNGNVTVYAYDTMGNQILSEQRITGEDGVEHIVKSHTTYDAEGRSTSSWQEVDGRIRSYSATVYDSTGQTLATASASGAAAAALPANATFEQIAAAGLVTEYTYDRRGQQIETRSQSWNGEGEKVWFTSRTVYDAAGRVVCQTETFVEGTAHLGVKATFTAYDSQGRAVYTEARASVVVRIDAGAEAKSSRVESDGRPVSFTEQAYDAAGRTLWSSDALGVKTLYFYTVQGALEYTLTDLDGDLETTDDQFALGKIVYDEYGRQLESLTNPDGDAHEATGNTFRTRYEYDDFGRVVATHYSDGTAVRTGYNALGQKVSETDALGQVTHFEYDADGRLSAVILPAITLRGASATHYGLAEGSVIHVRYEYEYDQNGNQTVIRDNVYQLDSADAATINRDHARETTFTYDWQGRQTSRTLPEGQTETFHYDMDGQLIRHVSFEDRVTVYQYDVAGRVTEKRFFATVAAWEANANAPGQTIRYTYDMWGRTTRIADSHGATTENVYDGDGRLVAVRNSLVALSAVFGAVTLNTIHYEYDEVTGATTKTWTTDGQGNIATETVNTYDRLGRLETVTATVREGTLVNEVTKYFYDLVGTLDKVLHANGVVTDYNYNAMNQLTDVTHYAADATPDNPHDNSEVLLKTIYELLANGFKSKETTTDAQGNTSTWSWEYDTLGRLVRELHDNHNDAEDFDSRYVFDLVGNRIVKQTDRQLDGVYEERVESSYDDNDRLLNERKLIDEAPTETTTYQWGAGGRATEQTGKTVKNEAGATTSRTQMKYNLQGRLSEIIITTTNSQGQVSKVTQEYVYDASGIKIRQTEITDADNDGAPDSMKDTTYVNDQQNHTGYSQVLEEQETTTDANGTKTKTVTYTIGHDVLSQFSMAMQEAIAAVGGTGASLFFLYDGHGSNRAAVDGSGMILERYNYDAYGNAVGFTPSSALTNLLYSGEQFNPASGLQYLRARWYNTMNGRFNRVDPFSGNINNPQSLNKYLYAHGAPTYFSDPSGEFIGLWLAQILLYSLVTYGFWGTVGIASFLALTTAWATINMFMNFGGGKDPVWMEPYSDPGRQGGDWPQNVFVDNISSIMNIIVDSFPGGNQKDKDDGRRIAQNYVGTVKSLSGQGIGGWTQTGIAFTRNKFGYPNESAPNCAEYATAVRDNYLEANSKQSFGKWTIEAIFDSQKFGPGYEPFINKAYHSYAILSYDGVRVLVLDPWATNRPNVYSLDFFNTWPIPDEQK